MTNENHVVWLRLVDAGTDSECWFVCNRCDPGAIPFIAESEITRPAEVGGDGDTQRLDFMLLHGFTVKRMVDTGGYMLLHEEYPFDGGEFETPREAIDAALLDFQSPPTPGSEAKK